ncbi:Uncharacterized protein LW94_14981 [Fusarium fujikuroi]|nr:Uncharacterized protein LW93_5614 [Fusarium fujikuroi]KLP09961.1 Uncharacterized protein LW94_14981 [Fusarium fujikuroi]
MPTSVGQLTTSISQYKYTIIGSILDLRQYLFQYAYYYPCHRWMLVSQLIRHVKNDVLFRVLGSYHGIKIKFHFLNGSRPFSPYLVGQDDPLLCQFICRNLTSQLGHHYRDGNFEGWQRLGRTARLWCHPYAIVQLIREKPRVPRRIVERESLVILFIHFINCRHLAT